MSPASEFATIITMATERTQSGRGLEERTVGQFAFLALSSARNSGLGEEHAAAAIVGRLGFLIEEAEKFKAQITEIHRKAAGLRRSRT